MAEALPNAEQIDVLLRVTRIFEQFGIQYFVGGSIASNVYGFYRATADADIVAALKPNQVEALAGALQAEFYADLDAIRNAASAKSSFNVIHLGTVLKVDVFVATSSPFHLSQFRRRLRKQVGAVEADTVWVASPEDTILAKLQWFRMGGSLSDKQWGDITGVMKIQKEVIDLGYLRDAAAEMQLTDLLNNALRDSGIIE